MKIDFSTVLLDPLGQPMELRDQPLTLGRVAGEAAFSHLPGDEVLDLAAKAKIGKLGLRVYDGGSHDLRTNEIETLKQRIGPAFGNLVAAQVEDLLDPPAADSEAA